MKRMLCFFFLQIKFFNKIKNVSYLFISLKENIIEALKFLMK